MARHHRCHELHLVHDLARQPVLHQHPVGAAGRVRHAAGLQRLGRGAGTDLLAGFCAAVTVAVQTHVEIKIQRGRVGDLRGQQPRPRRHLHDARERPEGGVVRVQGCRILFQQAALRCSLPEA